MSTFYKKGKDRKQQLFFPPSLDEYIPENSSIRSIDVYIDSLNFMELGFLDTRKSSRADGQKAYNPKMLMKTYLYGYLNKIRSSRMLERECKRNIELMWLTHGLTPSYHTIADFRKDNPKALRKTFKHFVIICKNLSLIGDGLKAVDGAFLRANASKNKLLMKSTLIKDLVRIDKKIEDYLSTLDSVDQEKQPSNLADNLPNDLEKLKAKQQQITEDLALLEELKKKQHNQTDPDASLMKKPAHNLMAYNSQIVVDEKFKLIAATDVSSKGCDNEQLYKMSKQTKDNLNVTTLDITADKGYYSAKELKKCVDENIYTFVPEVSRSHIQLSKGKYTRQQFEYDAERDRYICPNKATLSRKNKKIQKGKTNIKYESSSKECKQCPIRNKCISTNAKSKQLYRWEYEKILDQHTLKMKTPEAKGIVKKRSSIVEHPFGTIKRMLGWDHFLVRGKEKVSGENSLIMLCYNFKRVINIMGNEMFKKLIQVV